MAWWAGCKREILSFPLLWPSKENKQSPRNRRRKGCNILRKSRFCQLIEMQMLCSEQNDEPFAGDDLFPLLAGKGNDKISLLHHAILLKYLILCVLATPRLRVDSLNFLTKITGQSPSISEIFLKRMLIFDQLLLRHSPNLRRAEELQQLVFLTSPIWEILFG